MSQFLRVIPSQPGEAPCMSNGTKVVTEDGTEINGITKIELYAQVGDVWRAVIHVNCQAPDSISANARLVHHGILPLWKRLIAKALGLHIDETVISSKSRVYNNA